MPGTGKDKSVTRTVRIDVSEHPRPFSATPIVSTAGRKKRQHRNSTMDESQNHRLSRAALLEHNEYHSPLPHATLNNKAKTITNPSKGSRSDQMTEEEQSDHSPLSLVGTELSTKAFNVTRRLSKSVYLMAAFENLRLKQDQAKKEGNSVLENTYKLRADEGEHFKADEVKDVIEHVLEKFLNSRTYDPKESSELCCQLSTVIKNRVKDLDMPRYKIVCNVTLSEKNGQAMEMASRCLWDHQTDNYAYGTFQNGTICAVATVHGVYFE